MAGGRPVIGICAATEQARWAAWDVVAQPVAAQLLAGGARAGGMPLILPPDDVSAESPDELLDLLDGLILAGGADVDAGSYGARPHPETAVTWPERDRFELALGHRALERDMPFLGICRGMQMLNVTAGGTLDQHLPDRVGHEDHRHTPGVFADHAVRLSEARWPAAWWASRRPRSSPITTRESTSWARAWRPAAGPTTAWSRPSSFPTTASPSECCGTPRRTRPPA